MGGAGTLACGNGAKNSFLTEPALFDDVHSAEQFGAREQRWHVAMVQESQFPEEDNEHAMASEPGALHPHPPSVYTPEGLRTVPQKTTYLRNVLWPSSQKSA